MTTERLGTPRLGKEPDTGSSASFLLRSQREFQSIHSSVGGSLEALPACCVLPQHGVRQHWLLQDALLQAAGLHSPTVTATLNVLHKVSGPGCLKQQKCIVSVLKVRVSSQMSADYFLPGAVRRMSQASRLCFAL